MMWWSQYLLNFQFLFRCGNDSDYTIPRIEATSEQLSWFGEIGLIIIVFSHILFFFSQCCKYWRNMWLLNWRSPGCYIWSQEDDADVLSGDGAGLAVYCFVSPLFTAYHWQICLWSWECNGNVNYIFTCGTIQVSWESNQNSNQFQS